MDSNKALELLYILNDSKLNLVTLDFTPAELANSLHLGKKFELGDTLKSLDKFYSLDPEVILFEKDLTKKSAIIAYQSGITIYDAAYVALSNLKRIPLFTADYKHHKKSISPHIIHLKEWNGKI